MPTTVGADMVWSAPTTLLLHIRSRQTQGSGSQATWPKRRTTVHRMTVIQLQTSRRPVIRRRAQAKPVVSVVWSNTTRATMPVAWYTTVLLASS